MADTDKDVTVKLIDKNNELFTFPHVKSFSAGASLTFTDQDGEEHFTNAEYHVTVKPKKP